MLVFISLPFLSLLSLFSFFPFSFYPSFQFVAGVIVLMLLTFAAAIYGFLARPGAVSMSDSAQPAELPQYIIAQLVEPSLEHRVPCLAFYYNISAKIFVFPSLNFAVLHKP